MSRICGWCQTQTPCTNNRCWVPPPDRNAEVSVLIHTLHSRHMEFRACWMSVSFLSSSGEREREREREREMEFRACWMSESFLSSSGSSSATSSHRISCPRSCFHTRGARLIGSFSPDALPLAQAPKIFGREEQGKRLERRQAACDFRVKYGRR